MFYFQNTVYEAKNRFPQSLPTQNGLFYTSEKMFSSKDFFVFYAVLDLQKQSPRGGACNFIKKRDSGTGVFL